MNIKLRFPVLILALMLCILPLTSSASTVFAFEAPSYDVYVGKTQKIKPVAQGIDGKLTYAWSSSDEKVATVKDGTVKGISAGIAVITCIGTAKDGTSYKASFTSNVLIQSAKITADKKEVTLAPRDNKIGMYQTYTPVLTIEPENASNKELEWSSSSGVAYVDESGRIVSSWGAGTASITGKAKDGSGKSVKIKVTVPKCYVTEKSITITEPSGAEFGYIYASVNGISMYSTRVKGNFFEIDEKDDDESGMSIVSVTPVKAGSGSISFVRNGSTLATVKIKVEKSAIRDKSTYPIMDIEKVIANKESSIGLRVHQEGIIVATDGETVFAYVDGESRQYFAFIKKDNQVFEKDHKYLIYGVIEDFVPFTSETGLSYDCPLLSDVSFKRI